MEIRCPICRSKSRYLHQWTPPYSINSCPSCGALFAYPMPSDDELSEFYQGFLYRRSDAAKRKKLIERRKQELQRLFGRLERGLHFLDYGGGTGTASLAAAELGLTVTLYDIDEESIGFVRSLDATRSVRTCSSLSELEAESFDLIFADNVIEHVREPQALVSHLYGLLREHGELVIKTPHARNTELLFHPQISMFGCLRRVYRFNNLASAVSAAFFRPWTIDPPRHLYSFSARSLGLMAGQTGVDRAEIGYYRMPLWQYSLAKKLVRIPRSGKGAIRWFVLAVLALLEAGAKLIELPLRRTDTISASGLYIRITRDHATRRSAGE